MSAPSFDLATIRSLAALLTEADLAEIEVSGKDGRVRLARRPPAPVVSAPVVAQPLPSVERAPTRIAEADVPAHAIKSPMVGIAYLAPEPGAAPYITPGQVVTEGQTLLLIEAMKTFNQIKAPRSGTVTRILIASGTPVEYDEPLLILE